ncbi:MAG: sialidase family protein [Candidatus Binatia bacterium]
MMEMIKSSFVACIGHRVFALLAAALMATPTLGQANLGEVTWEARIEVAAGGGYRGPWLMNESDFRYVDDPTVAINDEGVVAVAWADQSRKDIFLQIYEANGKKRFEKPVNVSRSPRIFSWLPRMLITSGRAREIYILWQEIVFSGGTHGGEIFFARSTDGGKSFNGPLNLSNTIAGAGKGRLTRSYWHNGSLDLALASDGNLYAAWTEYEGALRFSRSTDRGRSFSNPLHVAGDDRVPARGPSLAVDADGSVYLVWTVGEDRSANIHFAKSGDRGRSFGEPRTVFKSSGHSDAPKIAVDGKGSVHLVYAESPAGPFERYHIRYSRSNDRGRTFEKARVISSPHTEKFDSVNFPTLALDGADNLYVIWELFPSRREFPRGLGFAYSTDGGKTFASPSVVPGTTDPAFGSNGGQQGLLMQKLAVNGAGAVAIVNSTFKPNETSRIWLFRGRAARR